MRAKQKIDKFILSGWSDIIMAIFIFIAGGIFEWMTNWINLIIR